MTQVWNEGRWPTLKQLGVKLTTGPFGTVLSAKEYVDDGVPLINPSHIQDGQLLPDFRVSVGSATARRLQKFRLREGDLIVARKGELGRSALVGKDAEGWLCGSDSIVIRPNVSRVDPRFLQWAMTSRTTLAQLQATSTGATMGGTNERLVLGVRIWGPPVGRQRKIADFLDRETARIDDLLDRKGRLLDSLYERRRCLTADAVLGGTDAVRALSASARGRDQTEEAWLDGFPSDWHRCRLRNLVSEIKNGTWGNEPEPENEGVVCVRAADFDRQRNRVSREKLVRRSVSAGELVKHRLDPGDLVLEKSGGGDQQPVGAAVLYDLPEPAVATNFAARVRPAPDVDSRYLNYVLAAVYDLGLNRRSIKQTTGIQNLDTRAFFSEPWAVPPYDEQVTISDRLDRATSLLDRIMDKQKRAVELFQERRKALITAAVTGEIDVPVSAA